MTLQQILVMQRSLHTILIKHMIYNSVMCCYCCGIVVIGGDISVELEMGIVDLFEYWQIYEYQYLHSPSALQRVACSLLNDAAFFTILSTLKKQGMRNMFMSKRGQGGGASSIFKGFGRRNLFGNNGSGTGGGRHGDGFGSSSGGGDGHGGLGEKSWFLHEGLCGVLFRLHNIYCSQLEQQKKKQGME